MAHWFFALSKTFLVLSKLVNCSLVSTRKCRIIRTFTLPDSNCTLQSRYLTNNYLSSSCLTHYSVCVEIAMFINSKVVPMAPMKPLHTILAFSAVFAVLETKS